MVRNRKGGTVRVWVLFENYADADGGGVLGVFLRYRDALRAARVSAAEWRKLGKLVSGVHGGGECVEWFVDQKIEAHEVEGA